MIEAAQQERIHEQLELEPLPAPAAETAVFSAPPSNGLEVLYIFLLLPGVFLGLMGMGIYPPLQSRLPMAILLGLFLIPSVALLASFVHPRPNANRKRRRALLLTASGGLLLLGAALFANGAMDHSPALELHARVARKSIVHARQGTEYDLVVTSGEPAQGVERLYVTPALFHRAEVGKDVNLELHKGYLGLPWGARIPSE